MFPEFLHWAESNVRGLQNNSYGNRLFRKIARLQRLATQRGIGRPAVPSAPGRSDADDTTGGGGRSTKHLDWLREHAQQIHGAFLVIIILSMILRLCDILIIGPAKIPADWVSAILMALIGWDCAHRTRPATALIRFLAMTIPGLLLLPSGLPRGRSCFSRVVNDWFWAETWYGPVEEYLGDDVSDMGEVRLFLVGWVLSGLLYLCSVAMTYSDSFLWIPAVGAGAFVVVHIGMMFMFEKGPWMWIWFKVGDGAPGTLLERPYFKLIRHSILSMTRVILFKVNRVVRWAARPVEGWVEPEWAVEFGELLPPESEYQYGDLRPAQIRLLRLLPGRHPEPIRCRLEVSDLDSQLSFEAISYVWGKGKFDRFVVVDGKRLNVMESAYSVLQRRRSRRVERVLWIDQICINQADIVERASQVRVMKELYASADRVVAWLGHSESAHLVQSFFGELQYQQEGLGFTGEELRNAAGRGGGAKWQALCEFLRNEWFTRIWIIQEATFSRELHLLYGDVCMDWDLVGEAIPALWHWDMLQSIPALDGSYFSDARKEVFTGLRNADTMLEFRGDVDYGRIFNVFTALENCVGFRCSEPRDKIYALTNIFDDVRITPDYGIPVAKLFTQIMLDILKKGNSLDAIAWAGTGFGARAIEDLPSWVPDWNEGRLQNTGNHIWYDSGTAYDPVLSFGRVDGVYTVSAEGWERDRIAHLTSSLEIGGDTDPVGNTNRQWSWYTEAEDIAMQYAVRYGEESLLESFMRTVLGDRVSVTKMRDRPTRVECLETYAHLQEYFSLFERARLIIRRQELQERITATACRIPGALNFENLTPPSESEKELVERFIESASAAQEFLVHSPVQERRFCVTEEGRMAVVPRGSNEGDMVCVMKGGRVPFVLRGPKKLTGPAIYEVVGSCYVHGLMDRGWMVRPADKFTLV